LASLFEGEAQWLVLSGALNVEIERGLRTQTHLLGSGKDWEDEHVVAAGVGSWKPNFERRDSHQSLGNMQVKNLLLRVSPESEW
jgi:hypothetical protein